MPKASGWIPVVLVLMLVCALLVMPNVRQIKDWATWQNLIHGFAVSLIAAVFGVVFLRHTSDSSHLFRETTDSLKAELSELKDLLSAKGSRFQATEAGARHFLRIERNGDMGEDYWVSLINRLDSDAETAWFAGTRMTLWLSSPVFKEPLVAKLRERLRRALVDNDGSDDSYKTIILLSSGEAVAAWREFCQVNIIRHVIDSIYKTKQGRKREEARYKLEILLLPEQLPYSLVLCGDRLAVTAYVSTGKFPDSPTLDIDGASPVRSLYRDDLARLYRAVERSAAPST